MGLMQRQKGKRFERDIAARLRAWWPGAEVRRSSQAERAYESDVFVSGDVPPLVAALWLELQDARAPTPLKKLEQAERDSRDKARHAVVVWHRLGERSVHVTMRLRTLAIYASMSPAWGDAVVTLELDEFLRTVSTALQIGRVGEAA